MVSRTVIEYDCDPCGKPGHEYSALGRTFHVCEADKVKLDNAIAFIESYGHQAKGGKLSTQAIKVNGARRGRKLTPPALPVLPAPAETEAPEDADQEVAPEPRKRGRKAAGSTPKVKCGECGKTMVKPYKYTHAKKLHNMSATDITWADV